MRLQFSEWGLLRAAMRLVEHLVQTQVLYLDRELSKLLAAMKFEAGMAS